MLDRTKTVLKLFTPPIIVMGVKKIREPEKKTPPHDQLFDGDEDLFKRVLASTGTYAEYGCGASTIWVAKNTNASIFSIDSSAEWIDLVRREIGHRPATLTWIDCGALGDWGTPLSYERRDNFSAYASSIWRANADPDTVLIDGRFRVCCFLTSLKHAKEGTRIIFDDYINRPQYHIVEEIVPRTETYGRQALFIVPSKGKLNSTLVNKLIDKFEYVMS